MKRLILALTCLSAVDQLQAAQTPNSQSTQTPHPQAGYGKGALEMMQEQLAANLYNATVPVKEGLTQLGTDLATAATTLSKSTVTLEMGKETLEMEKRVSQLLSKAGSVYMPQFFKEANQLIQTAQRAPINVNLGIDKETAEAIKDFSKAADKISQGVTISHVVDITPRAMRFGMGFGVAGAGVAFGCAFGKTLAVGTFGPNKDWKTRVAPGAGLLAIAGAIGAGVLTMWSATK